MEVAEAFTKSEIQEHHLQSLRVVTVEMELVIQLKQELPFIMAVVVEEDHSHLMTVHLVDKVVVVLAGTIATDGGIAITAGGAGSTAVGQFVSEITVID